MLYTDTHDMFDVSTDTAALKQLMIVISSLVNETQLYLSLSGILVPAKIETVGLGGTLSISFKCNACDSRNVTFEGSARVEGSRQTVIGLALAVA